MFKDLFDKLCWLLLVAAIGSLAVLLFINSGADGEIRSAGLDKSFEREMAYRARVELISKIYEPVEILHKQGNNQSALLKLDELTRKYPVEGHGYILQGQILWEMGAMNEAAASLVEGVKLNGDYVDDKSPLSRRDLIQRLVAAGLKDAAARAAANPGNKTLEASLQKFNYLKSRLAGGCE